MASVVHPAEAAAAPVMFVTRKWAPAVGGMETWSHRLSEELALTGPVEVVALPGRAGGAPPSIAALLAFPLIVVSRYLAARRAPAILHLGDMALWPLGLIAFLRRSRVVISAHGTDVSYARRGGFRASLYGAYLRLGARLLAAPVTANSRATADAAREFGWHDVSVIPLATELAGPLPDGSHDGTILFAGRLIALKGCRWFTEEVLPLLPPELVFAVAGTVWDEAEGAVRAHPRVRWLGALSQEDLAQAYSRALCVVMPALEPPNGQFEGFGLVACEAAACGGIVLAARAGGLTDAVRDGESGMLVQPGDGREWADAILQVAGWNRGERLAFTRGAIGYAQRHFRWHRVAQATRAVYARVVA